MKNATVDFKTAKDYPIGTKFVYGKGGNYTIELLSVDGEWCTINFYENGVITETRIMISNSATFNDRVTDGTNEVVYPKSKNFNTLYEKLNGF